MSSGDWLLGDTFLRVCIFPALTLCPSLTSSAERVCRASCRNKVSTSHDRAPRVNRPGCKHAELPCNKRERSHRSCSGPYNSGSPLPGPVSRSSIRDLGSGRLRIRWAPHGRYQSLRGETIPQILTNILHKLFIQRYEER